MDYTELIIAIVALVTVVINMIVDKLRHKRLDTIIKSADKPLFIECPYCGHKVYLKNVKIYEEKEPKQGVK